MTRLRFRVEKLIRDGLPAMMRGQGLAVFERRLDEAEFVASLKAKLVEEALEAQAAESEGDLVEELADLSEVMLVLARTQGLSAADIETRRLTKQSGRGGFGGRIFNAAVEIDEGLPAADYYLARPTQYPRVE